MDDFYILMELIYQFNKKHPEIRFGQLIQTLTTQNDDLFYMSNAELLGRLAILLNETD